ncbi:MAG: glucose-6-phosphate dehydrogenase [Candidatus Tectimicrobiota bacterium]
MYEQGFEVNCTGMAQGPPPAPCVMVICGAAGDLSRTTLIPSLYALACQQLLPEPFAVLGIGRRDWSDDAFRQAMEPFVQDRKDFRPDTWQQFARRLHFVSGDFSAPAADVYAALQARLSEVQQAEHIPDNVLFHLSVPPHLYGEIVHKLGTAALLQSQGGWRRIIIEKPFGYDTASARALDQQLLTMVSEDQLYRVDHYLGKETVQNMLVFRFANPGFEPIWNHQYIDHVQITVAEAEGIGTRAGYYDTTGVMRDMVQNHLLQLLCLTAMEPPVSYNGLALRNETAKVLQAIGPLDVQHDCVLGQYEAGAIEGKAVRAYRQEENVAAGSTTPTFAALKLTIDNWRWARVPFYVRTGKRLPRKCSEITIQFKPTPHLMFPLDHGAQLPCNFLTFCLQPNEGITYTFLAKQPGPDICLRPVTMHFRYDLTFGIERPPSAYEWLLHDAMQGDQTLFARSDWIYDAWALVDPVIAHWQNSAAAQAVPYAAGTWGPQAADALLNRDGRAWQAH